MWFNELSNVALIGAPISKKLSKSKIKNAQAFQNRFAMLLHIAHNRYRIKEGTCPDTINERVLKDALLWYGSCTFFKKDGVILALPSRPTNDYNLYSEPGFAWVWGRNGFNQKIKLQIPQTGGVLNKGMFGEIGEGEGVFVRDNERMYPFINFVYETAEELADTLRTLDVQRFNCKKPYVVTAAESVIPSVERYFDKVRDNDEFIVSSGIFDVNQVAISPLPPQANEIKVQMASYDWYMSKFLELCGINSNQASSKKENLVVDEVNANNEITLFGVETTVKYLNKQMETVNALFGTNIEWEVSDYGKEQNIQTDDDGETTGAVSGDER